MCDPMTALLAGSSILSAAGSIQSGDAQQTAANAQAAQDDQSATSVQQQGYQTAKRIRTQGASTVSAATAALSASGVDVSQGSANDVRQKIDQNAQQDALNTILSSDSKATNLRSQADLERQGGANAATAGKLGAVSSLLKGGAAFSNKSGWKTAAQSQ